MPNTHVIRAKKVLDAQNDYPEIVVSYAQVIVTWNNEKREAMQWLWTHRNEYHCWLNARVGKTHLERGRAARRALSTIMPREKLNAFHRACNYLGQTERCMGMAFVLFDSLMKTLECSDLALMYKYFSCSNARRVELDLGPVSFLRWVNGTVGIEVLAWRLSTLSVPQSSRIPS